MKNSILDKFMKEHEESVLSEENQELLQMHGGNSDDEAVDPTNDRCDVTNNCNGGNCVAGCGSKG